MPRWPKKETSVTKSAKAVEEALAGSRLGSEEVRSVLGLEQPAAAGPQVVTEMHSRDGRHAQLNDDEMERVSTWLRGREVWSLNRNDRGLCLVTYPDGEKKLFVPQNTPPEEPAVAVAAEL